MLEDIEQTFLKLKKEIEESKNPNHPSIMALNALLPEKYRVTYPINNKTPNSSSANDKNLDK